jgi:hypothetical protein
MPEQDNAFAQIVAQSWEDAEFRARLLADPAGVLGEKGFQVPPGKRVEIVEDTDDVIHLTLPSRPRELSDENLDAVAGGGALSLVCGTMCGTAAGGFSW